MSETSKFKIESFIGDNLFKELEKDFFSEEFTLKDLGVSARVLQNWSEKGLLPDKKRKEDENHKFNFIDLIWLKLVYELRCVGLSLEKIKKIKTTLYEKRPIMEMLGKKEDESIPDKIYSMFSGRVKNKEAFYKAFSSPTVIQSIEKIKHSQLHYLITMFIEYRYNIKVLVFTEGESMGYVSEIHSENLQLMELLEKETFISIPLFKLIYNFMDDEKNYNFLSKGFILNPNEFRIFCLIKEKKYEKITIHFKDKKPEIVEVKERRKINLEARLSDILLSRGYETLEIKTQDGKIAYSPITTKIIL